MGKTVRIITYAEQMKEKSASASVGMRGVASILFSCRGKDCELVLQRDQRCERVSVSIFGVERGMQRDVQVVGGTKAGEEEGGKRREQPIAQG